MEVKLWPPRSSVNEVQPKALARATETYLFFCGDVVIAMLFALHERNPER